MCIIVCSNDDPGLTLTFFFASSNFATKTFMKENMTMMDSLDIITGCDLEIG